VVYYFKPTRDCNVTASLCGSASLPDTFDSRLYLLAGVDQGGSLAASACSNDACGALPTLTVRDDGLWGGGGQWKWITVGFESMYAK